MKKSLFVFGIMAVVLLAGCAAPTIANISVPGSAKSVEPTSVGKNSALRYYTDASIEDACATQIKIMTDAKWTESEALENKGTYLKATYTDGKSDMVVLCSTTEISATEKSTKVTLTWMQNI